MGEEDERQLEGKIDLEEEGHEEEEEDGRREERRRRRVWKHALTFYNDIVIDPTCRR